MKARYDPEVQALYVALRDLTPGCAAYTKSVGPVNVDYDTEGEIVGYEFLLAAPLEILPKNTGKSTHE